MPIITAAGFAVGAQVPLDDRNVVADVTTISSTRRYEGMLCYQTGTSSVGGPGNYQLVGGILDGNWVALGSVQRVIPLVQSLSVVTGHLEPDASYDAGYLGSLSESLIIDNPTGTKSEFQKYLFRIKAAFAETLEWDTEYRNGTQFSLPSVMSGSGKTDYFGFMWNALDSKWDMVARATGF